MQDIRTVKDMNGLIGYFSENLGWNIDLDDFEDIEDISYDFSAADIGLKEEAFAKIASMRQLQPMTEDQQWGIFCIEFESSKFEVSAMRKILSGLIPRRRASVDHAVWQQQDLLFICNWGEGNNRTIGLAHFEDREKGLPQIKMISCAPALEDFTQIKHFEDSLSMLAWPKDTSDIDAWRTEWSNAFSVGYREVIQTSSTLTIRLAAEAQNIRNRILDTLAVERSNGYVHLLCEKFRNTLIHDMTEQAFADMYAQTVVYGLFSARCMDPSQNDFNVNEAVECIPNTNPFLKNLMRDCLGAEVTGRMQFDELDVGNVVDLLAHTNTDAIIKDFNRQTGGGREDPVIHFYEEFLTAYDKAQKVQRGVFYTPQPVVNFIVRAVDDILKTEFGLPEGLASTATKQIKVQRKSKKKNANGLYTLVEDTETVPAVQVLDPATGTGTFLRQVILQIYENFRQQHQDESEAAIHDAWNVYVPKHLLPRINGFELMMAPYAVAHMKLAMVLKDTGYDFGSESRLNVCLTNTLEAPGNSDDQISFFEEDPLAMESIEANKVKKNAGVSIFIGNPPYSGESANKGEYIMNLMEEYKKEPGGKVRLQERNPKWLNDDYVKFIRFAENTIDRCNNGILAYICPHGFIDNPTFRGMRWHLQQTFTSIRILDLHGNAKKAEVCPDGSKDENVFDIQQGVCVLLAVKKPSVTHGNIYHADLFGLRKTKYENLCQASMQSLHYQSVNPIEPHFFFVSKDMSENVSYKNGFCVNELFTSEGVGVTTAHDDFVIDYDRDTLISRFTEFKSSSCSDALYDAFHVKEKMGWDITEGWHNLQSAQSIDSYIQPIAYRVFDDRYIMYEDKLVWRTARKSMEPLLYHENIALCVSKFIKAGNNFYHVFVTNKIIDNCFVSNKTGERTYSFALYNYNAIGGPSPNLSTSIVEQFEKQTKTLYSTDNTTQLNPWTLFFYVYGILHSQKYRTKYSELLKIDFPRIPYPIDKEYFLKIAKFGEELVGLHLLKPEYVKRKSENIDDTRISYIKYDNGIITINATASFWVHESTWNFTIGAYQPLQKWLKDRKGHTLTQADIEHYRQMIAAIEETQRIMQEIDTIIEL